MAVTWAGGEVSKRYGSLPPDPPAPATLASAADAGWGPRKHELVTWLGAAPLLKDTGDLVSEPIVFVSITFYSKRAGISTVFMEVPRDSMRSSIC